MGLNRLPCLCSGLAYARSRSGRASVKLPLSDDNYRVVFRACKTDVLFS
jgi:hypothetical protein